MGINWGGMGTGAASGAATGSMFGPWGTAIGGVAGGLLGMFSGDGGGSSGGGGVSTGGGGYNFRIPTPEEIIQAQLGANEQFINQQVQFTPMVTQAEIERMRQLVPATAALQNQAQAMRLDALRNQFPQFFSSLSGLGDIANTRLQNFGQLTSQDVNQILETTGSALADRGFGFDSPLTQTGTAGQIAKAIQAQKEQDILIQKQFAAENLDLMGRFDQNLPYSTLVAGLPGAVASLTQPNVADAYRLNLGGEFSRAALDRTNALLGAGNSGGGGMLQGILGAASSLAPSLMSLFGRSGNGATSRTGSATAIYGNGSSLENSISRLGGVNNFPTTIAL